MEKISPSLKKEIEENTETFKNYKEYVDTHPWDINPVTLEGYEETDYKDKIDEALEQKFGIFNKQKMSPELYARKLFEEEHRVHKNILETVNGQITYILKQVTGYEYLKVVKEFTAISTDIIATYKNKVEKYNKNVQWMLITDNDLKIAEMRFQQELLNFKSKLNVKLNTFNINDDEVLHIPYANDVKVPFILWGVVEQKEHVVQDYIKRNKVKLKAWQ